MKKIVLSVFALCLAFSVYAQEDTTGSTMNQPVRKPLELSWEQTEVGPFSENVPYVYQRNADVMYYHTIWRTIDLREKMNHPLYFPQETRGTWRSMAQVILDAIDVDHPEKKEDEVLPVYTDEFCTMYKDREAVRSSLSEVKVIDSMDVETFEVVGQKEIVEKYEAKQILMYRVKEIWFFDKKRSVLEVRILEIEPMLQVEREVGGSGAPGPGQEEEEEEVKSVKAWKRLGYIMYDELRPYLVKQEMYNPKNNAQRLSLDDMMTWKREFSSFIYQEQNVYNNRQIDEYIANARDQRIESERITEKIRSFEHDLWEF
jgi:gliding motility associated protien GldN